MPTPRRAIRGSVNAGNSPELAATLMQNFLANTEFQLPKEFVPEDGSTEMLWVVTRAQGSVFEVREKPEPQSRD